MSPTTFTFKTVGDCQIEADVYSSSIKTSPSPALVYIHGGALINGARVNINPEQLQLYLDSGYSVISIDYRLAPETKLPEIIEDLQDAFRWINDSGPKLFNINPAQIAVVGHSAGGYLALMTGFCIAPLPKAIVSFYGYGDIIGDWYGKPDPFYCQQPKVTEDESGRLNIGPPCTSNYEGRGKEKFYLYCRQNGSWPKEVSGHDPIEEPEFFRQFCPVKNVTENYPPTLLLHGDQDTDVPYQQSVLMTEAFTENKVKHELISMEGLGHGFDSEMNDSMVKDAFSKVLDFMKLYLQAP